MPPAKRPTSKRSAGGAQRKRAGRLVNALAEAAWTETDSALAEAVLECDRAKEAESKKAREEALELLFLALARAARRRGLARIGKLGAIEDFDPARHEFTASSKRTPKRVRIVAKGVARGRQVLIKARAGPVRARAKRS